MRFTVANGVVLHHSVTGPAEAPTVVFSNSLGTDFRVWDPLLAVLGPELLDRGFRVIRYDKRGHGLSEATSAPYGIEDHVADLCALLDRLKVTSALVVGLSVGGLIAQGLAAARPDLVRGLVLCDTAHKIGPRETWEQRIAAIEAGGIEALADAIMERWFSAAFRRDRPAELTGWRNMLVRTPLAGYLGTAAAIRDADLTEAAGALTVPTLCVAGSEDGATPPELVATLAGLIPGARFEVIEGAGHLPCVEAPEALASLIRNFFLEADLAR